MGEQPTGWRVVVIAIVLPIAEPLIETVRGDGPRRRRLDIRGGRRRRQPPPPWGETGDKTAPQGVNVIFARDKADLAPLLRGLEPDVVLCWGFPWKIPQDALDVPRYGAVNQHPALLPRHRGPIPLSWALREGDPVFGSPGTGWTPSSTPGRSSPRRRCRSSTRRRRCSRSVRAWSRPRSRCCRACSSGSRPAIPASRRRPRARPGAGMLEEDYATIDWCRRRRARSTTRCARGTTRSRWARCEGPFAELDGKRVKVKRTSLTDPGDGSPAVETGDGQIWILETEPFETDPPA